MPAETLTVIIGVAVAFAAFAIVLLWADHHSKGKRGPVA